MTAPARLHGGFEETEMYDVLARACAVAGLDSRSAEILRGHTNAVVRLKSAPVVVKIARRGSRPGAVEETIRFVRWLMDRDFPTVSLYPVPEQPVVVDGHAVTLWTYLAQPEEPVSAEKIAPALRSLHRLPEPSFPLKHLDNIAAIKTSLASTTTLPDESMHLLTERVNRLERDLAGVRYVLPEAVLQGDPQHRNALHHQGGAVLCDWDTAAWGQPEWDLVTIEVHCRRFGYGPEHYRRFADAYGFDVTAWPGYPILRDIRELRMITTNAKKSTHTPGTLAEVQRRIAGLRREDAQMTWSIL